MRCLRLTHVNLRVGSLPEAVRFYQAVLGLEPIERRDRSGRGAWFRLGDSEIHLAEDPAPQPLSQRHFAVLVADLAEARRSLEQARVDIEREDTGRFWTRDPSGNRIEIVQA